MVKAYPLEWPIGYPRTQYPKTNYNFKTSFATARDECLRQIKMLKGRNESMLDVVISTDIPTRNDGLPYANAASRTMKSQGVAVYFNYNGSQRVFCCDKWDKVDHNMHAISMSIEAIRGLDRWGVSDMLNRVFTGFEALPQKETRPWWVVLEVEETATTEQVKLAYREQVLKHHPDRGGHVHMFQDVQQAYQTYQNLNNKK